jgi:predicted nucleotidyltransferase
MNFPTVQHARVAELLAGFFENRSSVDTVLVVNSCARGKAIAESDLDMAVLVEPGTSRGLTQEMEAAWHSFASRNATIAQFMRRGPYSKIHLDLFDGHFDPVAWDESGGPDVFEIEIGNRIEHSLPIHTAGPYFKELQAKWLPFYGRDLRKERIEMVRGACAYDIGRVSRFFDRNLPFHAFDILYKAYQEFLQGVFICRQTYPVAYNKWIHEQIVEWLELPELYEDLVKVLSIKQLESEDILKSAQLLASLLDRWVREIKDGQSGTGER